MKIGTCVKLKSGGPQMIIENILETSIVKCSWYDDSGNKVIAEFNQASLVHVAPQMLID